MQNPMVQVVHFLLVGFGALGGKRGSSQRPFNGAVSVVLLDLPLHDGELDQVTETLDVPVTLFLKRGVNDL